MSPPRTDWTRSAIAALVGVILPSCAPEGGGSATGTMAGPVETPTIAADDCADVTPNAAYTECFRQLALAAERDVTAELTKVRKLVAAADAEYSRSAPGTLTADDATQLARHLALSHDNWMRYVEGQCALEATAARGGSGTDTLRQKCRLRLARLRLDELRGAATLIDGNR
jgi:uncharacterized protein YecT (DUF1311 family)